MSNDHRSSRSRLLRYGLCTWAAILIFVLVSDVQRYMERIAPTDTPLPQELPAIIAIFGIIIFVASMRRILRSRPLGVPLTGVLVAIPIYFAGRFVFAGPLSVRNVALSAAAFLVSVVLIGSFNPSSPNDAAPKSTGAA